MGFSRIGEGKYGRVREDENDSEDENEQQPPHDNRSARLDRAIGSFVMDTIGSLANRYRRFKTSSTDHVNRRRSCCGWFQLIYRSIMLVFAVGVISLVTFFVFTGNVYLAS